MIVFLYWICAGLASASGGEQRSPPEPIRVHEVIGGCEVETVEWSYAWEPDGGHFAWNGIVMPQSAVDNLRRILLASTIEPADYLPTFGLSQQNIDDHRDRILDALDYSSHPPSSCWRGAHLFELESVRQCIERDLRARIESDSDGGWMSTNIRRLKLTIPGSPPIVVESNCDSRWKIPWTITAGDCTWKSNDVAVSRALCPWLDSKSPNRWLADGNWTEEIWEDVFLWWFDREKQSGVEFEPWFKKFGTLAGYAELQRALHIDVAAASGESAFFVVSPSVDSKERLIDRMHWRNPLIHDQPSIDWLGCLRRFKLACQCVERLPWLKEWKASQRWGMIIVNLPDVAVDGDRAFDLSVRRAWSAAGFAGAPEFELRLQYGVGADLTFCVTHTEPVALITEANPAYWAASEDARRASRHWLGELNVSLRSRARSFVRVDANGAHAQAHLAD